MIRLCSAHLKCWLNSRCILQLFQNKQRWFVYLMIFFIGWSSVALASGTGQTITMLSHVDALQVMSPYDEQQTHHTMMHCQTQQNTQHVNDCHQFSKQYHLLQGSCSDCLSLLCQSSLSCLAVNSTASAIGDVVQDHTAVLNWTYLVHFSTGYKQDLLRPPQA